MTIGPTSPARVSFNCDSVSKIFPIPIQAYQASDFEVILTAPASAGGSQTVLNLNSDYSVAPSSTDTPPKWTLTTLPLTAYLAGYTLQVLINPVVQQQTQYVQGQAFPSLAVQTNFDRLTQMVQRLQDEVSRAVRAPDGDAAPGMLLPPASSRALMYPAFDANGNAIVVSNLPSGTGLTQQGIGAVLYPQTAGEAAAGAVPVNLWYPPGYVDRYGTNLTPGVTSMAAAFQAAINTCKQGGCAVRWGRTAPYLVDTSLNCTFSSSINQNGLYFDGSDGPVSTDGPGGGANAPGIIFKHTGYGFDLTGCDAYAFNNMSIGTDPVTFPQVCFFMARANVAGNNSQVSRYNNVRVIGSFSKSLMYNYASEDGVYTGCYFANTCTAPGTKTVTITAQNILGLTSSFVTIRTGSQSCTDHEFIGGQFVNFAGTSTSDVFYFDNVSGFKCYGAWILNSSASAGGRAYFYVDMTNGGGGHMKLRDIVGEDTTFYHQYGVFVSNVAGVTGDWAIQDCYLPNTVAAIASGALVTLDKFNVAQISEQAGNGMLVSGNLQNSTINAGTSLPLTVTGTSTSNLIIGTVTSIGVRVKTTVVDTTTGNIQTNGALGLANNAPPALVGGFGTPTGAAVVANFPGATATLLQTSNTVAEILTIMKNVGFIGS